MIRTLIVDDEPLAQEILQTYISQIPNLFLVASCNNAIEANDILRKEPVDLMLLDIEMPQLTGIEFLRSQEHAPMTIFTTAYREFAIQGFELNAIDYLLKPISFERFLKAINKVSAKIQLEAPKSLEALAATFIFVKADKKLIKLNFADIIYIEGLKDYVIIHTETQRVITLQTMKSLEEKLPEHIFLRAHRSFIINLNKIQAIVGNGIEVVERGQVKHLPIGKNYKDEMEAMIEKRKL
ncbi:MAG: LytTR family DNA-binding domain-containing protein [Bacteroidota bacterium]|nr:LytTR family DNA-binding domain-containing protein [Bacteroidota bacterium]